MYDRGSVTRILQHRDGRSSLTFTYSKNFNESNCEVETWGIDVSYNDITIFTSTYNQLLTLFVVVSLCI